MMRLAIVSGVALVLLTACSGPRKTNASGSELTQLVEWMSGDFSSLAQSQRDSDYYDIRLHIRPIWLHDAANHWLYVEQAMASAENKPYRQRIYKVERDGEGFKSIVYTLPEPGKWVGAYNNVALFDALNPADLSLRDGCTVYLVKKNKTEFSGETRSGDCDSNIRGAKYATSKVTITAEKLLSWDQGFNDKGEQVWGATKGGYEFVKIKH
ncbi:MAG: chromophore lyase CpcT/CpeT [Saprospiraceae bacterium]|nr:chromophore lyase CpcT/CpeT [Saprospiraceae bacterium]